MRKRLLLACGLLVGLTAGLLWYFTRSPNHRINRDGFGQLRLGMTEQEVIAVLGVPPGDYGPGKGEILEFGFFTMLSHSIRTDPKGKKWLAGDFGITVCFDDQGRVQGLGTDAVYRPYKTLPEMLCQRLGLQQPRPYPPGSWSEISNGN